MKTIQQLIDGGVLRFAVLPPDNPRTLEAPSYTVPLLEHDYPAKTAIMWNAVYRQLGLPVANVMMVGDPARTEEIFTAFRQDVKYLGGGAGVGFKDKSLPHLDEVEPMAKAMGAVNFILKTAEGRLKGFNTDGSGYAQSLEDFFSRRQKRLDGKKVVVLGAGGTSNAVAFALAGKKARLVILNRTVEKAQHLTEVINDFYRLSGEAAARFGGEELTELEVPDADVVVNVSTKGSTGPLQAYSALAPVKLPSSEENLRQNQAKAAAILKLIPRQAIVSDIVPVDGMTVMLRQAQNAGLEILDGVPMVINQAVMAFMLLHADELKERGTSEKTIKAIMQQAASG
jgi:shikimate dehydrogenase